MKTAFWLMALAAGLLLGWQAITGFQELAAPREAEDATRTDVVSRFEFRVEAPVVPGEIAVYEVLDPEMDERRFRQLMEWFDLDVAIDATDELLVARDEGRMLEASLRPGTGYIRYTNEAKLLSERSAVELPSDEEAMEKASSFLEERGWLPDEADTRTVGYYEFAEFDAKGELLDEGISAVSVIFGMTLGDLPVEGPGAKCSAAFGDAGELVGAARVWRDVGDAAYVPTIPFESALKMFKGFWPEEGSDAGDARQVVTVVVEDMYVAYYAGPGVMPQEAIEPILVFTGYSVLTDLQGTPIGDPDPFWQSVPLVE